MALNEEEKQKIIEEEKLRAKVRKETKGIGCGTGIIIFIVLILLGSIMQYQKFTDDIKSPKQKFARSIKTLNKHTSQKNCEIIDIRIGGIMPSMKGPVYSILVDKNITKEKLKYTLLKLFNEKKAEKGDYKAVYITAFVSKEDYEDEHWAGRLNWSQGDDKPRVKFNENYWEYGEDYWEGIYRRISLKTQSISLADKIKSYLNDPKRGYKVTEVNITRENSANIIMDIPPEAWYIRESKGRERLYCIIDIYIIPVGYRCLHDFPELNQVNIVITLDRNKIFSAEILRDIAYSVNMEKSFFRDKSKKNIANIIVEAKIQNMIRKFNPVIYDEGLKKAELLTAENVMDACYNWSKIIRIAKVDINKEDVAINFTKKAFTNDITEIIQDAKADMIGILFKLFEEFPMIKNIKIQCNYIEWDAIDLTKNKSSLDICVTSTREKAEKAKGDHIGYYLAAKKAEILYNLFQKEKHKTKAIELKKYD
jgi:hypothetical protein